MECVGALCASIATLPPAPTPSAPLMTLMMNAEVQADTDIISRIFGPAPEIILPELSDGEVEEEGLLALQRAVELEDAVGQRAGNTLSYSEKLAVLDALKEKERRLDYQGHLKYFPETGPYSRHNYPKHIEFLQLGAQFRERMFMAGNRVGKSITGGYELACHLTGIYPPWWEGKRFSQPVDCWAAGDTGQTTRDIIQTALLGQYGDWGTGLIPGHCLPEGAIRMRPGIPGAVDTVRVIHASGGVSKLGFKSYDQKRRAFQGVEKHAIWLDEEPPIDVYTECLFRTMTTGGIVMVTFTPLMGITTFVQSFLEASRRAAEFAANRKDN